MKKESINFSMKAIVHQGDNYPTDENGDDTSMTTHEGYQALEDAIEARDILLKKQYSNIKNVHIYKNKFITMYNEEGEEEDSDFETARIL